MVLSTAIFHWLPMMRNIDNANETGFVDELNKFKLINYHNKLHCFALTGILVVKYAYPILFKGKY
jgi:hypothetical protein